MVEAEAKARQRHVVPQIQANVSSSELDDDKEQLHADDSCLSSSEVASRELVKALSTDAQGSELVKVFQRFDGVHWKRKVGAACGTGRTVVSLPFPSRPSHPFP